MNIEEIRLALVDIIVEAHIKLIKTGDFDLADGTTMGESIILACAELEDYVVNGNKTAVSEG